MSVMADTQAATSAFFPIMVNSHSIVAKKPATVSNRLGALAALGDRRSSLSAWQDRIRDPMLTILLVLEVCAIFLAAPLAAKGPPIARAIADTLVLAVLMIVVLLSQKWGAIFLTVLGLALTAASYLPSGGWTPVSTAVLRRGGNILAFSALAWVVAHAVYAPGRITFHRLQGAIVIYLSFATRPDTGDIVPVDPFARSLANLESVIGPFYLAITVARLVTMELADRRR
jgi:hypothetical protein